MVCLSTTSTSAFRAVKKAYQLAFLCIDNYIGKGTPEGVKMKI